MTCTSTFSKSCFLSSTFKRSLHWKQKRGETCDGSYFLWASSGPWPGMCVAVAQRAPREAWAPAIAECPKFCPDGITLLSLGQTLPQLCILQQERHSSSLYIMLGGGGRGAPYTPTKVLWHGGEVMRTVHGELCHLWFLHPNNLQVKWQISHRIVA